MEHSSASAATPQDYREAFLREVFRGTAWSEHVLSLTAYGEQQHRTDLFIATGNVCLANTWDETTQTSLPATPGTFSFLNMCLSPKNGNYIQSFLGDYAGRPMQRLTQLRHFRAIRDTVRTAIAPLVTPVKAAPEMIATLQDAYVQQTRERPSRSRTTPQLHELAALILPNQPERDVLLARAQQHFASNSAGLLAYMPHPELEKGIGWLADAYAGFVKSDPHTALIGSMLLNRILGVGIDGNRHAPQSFNQILREKEDLLLLESELKIELSHFIRYLTPSPVAATNIDPFTREGQTVLAKRIEAGVTAEQICAWEAEPDNSVAREALRMRLKRIGEAGNTAALETADITARVEDFEKLVDSVRMQAAQEGMTVRNYL